MDTQSAIGRFFFTLTAALAEMERGIVAERTKAALQHKKAKFEKTGGAILYGYQLSEDGNCLIENPAEQEVIQEARELKSSGLSLRAISKQLAKKGFMARNGKPFQAIQISRILAA